MKKEIRLKGKGFTKSDIDLYCKSVEETLTKIYDRWSTKESKKGKKKDNVYCLEDVLYY